jgi:hypothetical protein
MFLSGTAIIVTAGLDLAVVAYQFPGGISFLEGTVGNRAASGASYVEAQPLRSRVDAG